MQVRWSRIMRTLANAGGCALGLAALGGSTARAQIQIPVANHSFELPTTTFAWPDADIWEETGLVTENPQLPGVIDTLDTGVFFNSPVGQDGMPSTFFITNADGVQLAFIGAKDDEDIAFFQQLGTVFEPGTIYTLKVQVGESSFFPPLTFNGEPPPDPDPALLLVRLYHEDATMQKLTVAERIVSAAELPQGADKALLLMEFAAKTAASSPADAWVGKPIGIDIRPLIGLSGVWNLDNVRLDMSCGSGGLMGDANFDGLVDLTDHAAFATCLNGPRNESRPAGCPLCVFERLDANGDGDLDLEDAARFATLIDE